MAHLRIDNKGGEKYLRIVRSLRKDGKVEKQTLYSLGKVSDYSPQQLQRIGTRFFELGGGDPKELFSSDVEELGRYNYGYFQVFSKVLAHYGIDHLLKRVEKRHKLQFDLCNALMLMLLERLHEPCSKRSNYLHQQEFLGIKPVELHQLYRCLDYLADHQERIQQTIYQTGRDLFSGQLDVVFYDVTTFYFDSDKEHEGTLRQKGFSKDGKIGNTQILFGMLIDKNKQPIGYKVYKGDSYEGNTFKEALEQLKKQYQIKDVIVVADRGMLSKTNIAETLEKGYDFILGERLRTLPQAVKVYLTNKENYTKTWVYNHHNEVITLHYATYQYEGRTLICTYSQKRADKDAKEREAKLETAQILLKQPALLKKKAQHYFLKEAQNATFQLNEAKIEESKRFDGFLAIATNAKQISVEQALDHYRHLFQIEHSFRTYKSHLETRPMFHWTDKRIEGHMCLCYIAYTMLTYVQNKLKAGKHNLSENQIRDCLDSMQVSLINNQNNHFYLRAAQNTSMEMLSTFLGLKKLPNVLPQSEIDNYL